MKSDGGNRTASENDIDRPRSQSVERAILNAANKGKPLGSRKRKHGAIAVFRVANPSDVGCKGDLDAADITASARLAEYGVLKKLGIHDAPSPIPTE